MERKLYVKRYQLYFNDILVDDSILSSSYYYDVPDEEPRVCKTFKNFNDFHFKYKFLFDGYKNCIFRKIVKVGNTIIKKENILHRHLAFYPSSASSYRDLPNS